MLLMLTEMQQFNWILMLTKIEWNWAEIETLTIRKLKLT